MIFESASADGRCITCRAAHKNAKLEKATKGVENTGNGSNVAGQVRPYAMPIAVGVVLLSLLVGAYFIWQRYYTEEGRLRAVVAEYLDLEGGQESIEAFEYLTPESQKIGLEDWIELRQAIIGRKDSIVDVVLLSGAHAKVALFNGANTYSTTWRKVGGKWKRAYYEDNKQALERRFNLSSTVNEFELIDASYIWEIDKSNLTRQLLYRPQLKFRVRNTGANSIDRLEFRVHFVNQSANTIFSEASEYAIGSNDIPLEPQRISQYFFITSSIGFDLSETQGNDVARIEEVLKQKRSAIRPRIYFRTTPNGDWKPYEIQFQP